MHIFLGWIPSPNIFLSFFPPLSACFLFDIFKSIYYIYIYVICRVFIFSTIYKKIKARLLAWSRMGYTCWSCICIFFFWTFRESFFKWIFSFITSWKIKQPDWFFRFLLPLGRSLSHPYSIQISRMYWGPGTDFHTLVQTGACVTWTRNRVTLGSFN